MLDGIQMHVSSTPEIVVSIKELFLRGNGVSTFDLTNFTFEGLKFVLVLNIKGTKDEVLSLVAAANKDPYYIGEPKYPDFITKLMTAIGFLSEPPKETKESHVFTVHAFADVGREHSGERVEANITTFKPEDPTMTKVIGESKARSYCMHALTTALNELLEDLQAESTGNVNPNYSHPYGGPLATGVNGQACRVGGPPRAVWRTNTQQAKEFQSWDHPEKWKEQFTNMKDAEEKKKLFETLFKTLDAQEQGLVLGTLI